MLLYDHILQGADATEKNAIDHAKHLDWGEIEQTENIDFSRKNYDYIDTYNGIDIWYGWRGDYYVFSDKNDS